MTMARRYKKRQDPVFKWRINTEKEENELKEKKRLKESFDAMEIRRQVAKNTNKYVIFP